jgi:signal transduction histidine kinase
MRVPIIVKFVAPLVAVLALLGVLLNFEISRQIQTSLVNQAADFVVNFVQLQASRHGVGAQDFGSDPSPATLAHFNTLSDEVKTKGIVRMKVWNPADTILFSDDKTEIGQRFTNNEELNDTFRTGEQNIEITKPSKTENAGEKQYSRLLEIYIPIVQSGRTIGVIETYYDLGGLFAALSSAQRQIELTLAVGLSALAIISYLVLYFVVLRPVDLLSRQVKRIGRGDLQLAADIRSRDEMGDLFHEFNGMAKALQKLQQLKNEFVFVAAHELRAPVTVIKGNLDMATEEIIPPKEAIAQIAAANEHLQQLVNDLLEIARADSGKLAIELSPVDLADALRKATASFEPVAQKAGLKLITELPDAPVMVPADAAKLNEVMSNLISNAIKYSRVNGHVIVKLVEQKSKAIITVEDNGLGISEEAQLHLFQKFYRSPDVSSTAVGTGLGLYITRELVLRMKGAITFKSKLGSGTAFAIAFRLADHGKDNH